MNRRVVLSIIGVLICLGLGLAGFKFLADMKAAPEAAETAQTLVRVSVRKLKLQDFQETFKGYGRVHALSEAQVASEVQGLVVEIAEGLDVGRSIRKGQLLFRIDDADYVRAVARAEAQIDQLNADLSWKQASVVSISQQLEVAQRELEITQSELERSATLKKKGTESDRAYDAQRIAVAVSERMTVKMRNDLSLAQIDIKRGEAAIAAAEVDLRQAQDNLKRCKIQAPMTGVLSTRQVDLGARVAPGTLLAEITDPDRVEVAIAIPARLWDTIEAGRELMLRNSERAKPFPATITRVAPKIDSSERSFLVFAEILSTPERRAPAPGTFLHAEVHLPERKSVYAIPRTALLGDKVFVAERSQGQGAKVRSMSLEVLSLLPDVLISRDPKAEGLEIVLDNLEQISNGSLVTIVEATEESDL